MSDMTPEEKMIWSNLFTAKYIEMEVAASRLTEDEIVKTAAMYASRRLDSFLWATRTMRESIRNGEGKHSAHDLGDLFAMFPSKRRE
jgi:hypothetical protein